MYLFHKFSDRGSALLGSFGADSKIGAGEGEEGESVVDGSVAKRPTAKQLTWVYPTQPILSPPLQPRGNPDKITEHFYNAQPTRFFLY